MFALGLELKATTPAGKTFEQKLKSNEALTFRITIMGEPSAEVIELSKRRWEAKFNKDWAGADALRKELTAAGWSMLDGKDSYKLEPMKK